MSTNKILTPDLINKYIASQGYVYLAHAETTNRYKIGRTIKPVTRFSQLKSQSPLPVKIIDYFWTPDAIADEKAIHLALANFRIHGEWFELDSKNPDVMHSPINIKREFFFHKRPTILDLSTRIADKAVVLIEYRNTEDYLDINNQNIPAFKYSIQSSAYSYLRMQESLSKFLHMCGYLDGAFINNVTDMLSTSTGERLDFEQISLAAQAGIVAFGIALKFVNTFNRTPEEIAIDAPLPQEKKA